jgi:putative peptide zinc metalloprotease protein
VVLAVLGMRIVFNYNPLIKLDGYYLFSDLVEIPDLQQRAAAYMKAHLARLFWGGRRLAREEKGSVLITYGVASWLFGVTFLALLVAAVVQFLGESWSLIGIITALFLGVMVLQGPLHGLLGEKISQMIFQRHKRALLLATGAVLGLAILVFGRMDDRASGTFRVRPVVRAELRAPVAGFLREFVFDEGSRVPPGVVVLRLEVPNLANHRAEKQAEVREAEARVRLLEAGPGFAAVAEQRRRVEQAREWRDLAKRDLARVEQALAAEMVWLEQEVVRQHLELDYSAEALMRYQQLLPQRAISKDEYQRAEKRVLVHEVQLGQANALQRARKALGAREAEAELTWRERGLADAQGSLTLLEAGTQPTEIDTERSRLARAKEELNYVEARQKKTLVYSPVGGLMTTPHLAEKVGQYFREGELICTIDDPDVVDVEITLPDQESARVQPGQAVELKVLVRPAETFRGEVDRIVTRDGSADAHHSMTVYCRPDNPLPDLRPGTIGEARVTYGSGAIGKVLVDRVQRWLRTDFW